MAGVPLLAVPEAVGDGVEEDMLSREPEEFID